MSVNEKARLDRIEAYLSAKDPTGFGPTAPSTGGEGEDKSGWMPGEPITADGVTPLPWNAQAGQAGQQTFRGKTDIILQPEGNYSGWREFGISQVAPQFDNLSLKLDDDPTDLGGSLGGGGLVKVWFSNGQRRVMHVDPDPLKNRGPKDPVPCGHVRFVGGIPPQYQ